MKNVKVIKIKSIKPYHDNDRDGIPNWLDCNPYKPVMLDKKHKK